MIQILNNLLMATTTQSTATKKDWWLALVSLTPILPWFIFIPRLIRKLALKFNHRWFMIYSYKNHRRRVKQMFDVELV